MITGESTQAPAGFAYPTAADLQTLSRAEGPCVTIILGAHAGGTGSRPSATTLKTLLPEIKHALVACDVNPQDADSLLEPLEAMTDEAVLRAGHENPICIFRSPREFHCFSVRAAAEPEWHVDERFFVLPILAHLDYRNSFLLLALAAKHVRLLRCEGPEISAIPFPDGVPESEGEFIGETDEGENTSGRAATLRSSQSPAVKNPHFLSDFMKAIDRGLQPVYREMGLPLVLAGVDEETAAYRTVSEYASLVPQGLKLSPDGGVTGTELAHAAAEVLKHWCNPAEKQALADLTAMGPARRSTDSTAILQAAAGGRVQHLLVQRGSRMIGDAQRILGLGASEGYVYRSADLVNAAAVEVLKHKGMVWLLEPEHMPEAVPMAAVMRYAEDNAGG
jgi:hypothetical protein